MVYFLDDRNKLQDMISQLSSTLTGVKHEQEYMQVSICDLFIRSLIYFPVGLYMIKFKKEINQHFILFSTMFQLAFNSKVVFKRC